MLSTIHKQVFVSSQNTRIATIDDMETKINLLRRGCLKQRQESRRKPLTNLEKKSLVCDMETRSSSHAPSSPPATWPPYTASGRSFPANSLLQGTEPMIWRALGTMAPQIETFSKQMAIRHALCAIGLGWIATNTTPFRIVIGRLYDQALAQARQLSLNSAMVGDRDIISQEEEGEESLPNKRTKYTESALPSLEVSTLIIPTNPSLQGPWIMEDFHHRVPSNQQRAALWQDLNKYGACVIRNAVAQKDLPALTRQIQQQNEATKSTRLSETTGNGVAGTPVSRYMELPTRHNIACLSALELALWDLLTGDTGNNEALHHNVGHYENRHGQRPQWKNILLQYGEGAENWAHQDNNRETLPVQAVLTLSEPWVDFVGGQFYVARRHDPSKEEGDETVLRNFRHIVEWENAGDLVVFLAGKETGWWHGTMPVGKGTQDPAEPFFVRQAVGMLQPL